ncbi:MAG: hypothetical protein CMH22_15075 [Methylophaga sp.]|uniref:YdcF family protein n=1 Tax=uncultured Methylophaga sp. TaxID=285271 RepID=UPI000C5A38D1|nr:YdcF family protein [Methylophaga sp. UBA678]MAX53296.1 hypothetical protein [Methylophaga sp.]|tara:strand:- start:14470 stop:15321 length:852 start_codon:yes stop_codon:yes gene_type:complete
MDNLFFVLSKLVWGLLSPTSLMVWLLLLVTLLLWLNYIRVAKRLLLLMSLIGFIVMGYPVGDYLMYPLESRFAAPEKLSEPFDGIIMLGGAEQLKLSDSWQKAQVGDGAERILQTAELARLYPDLPIIVSGGSNLVQRQNLDSDGQVFQQLFSQAGIDASRLVIEPQARNTYENFQRLKPLLTKPAGTYVLVTSAFHMPRAVGIAKKQHINVIPYPVDYRSNHANNRYWDFDLPAHLAVLETAWHEWLGLTVYFLTGKTQSWFPQATVKIDKTDESTRNNKGY